MTRLMGAVAAALVAGLVLAVHALASTHQVSVGNYWYEDDAQHDQTKLVVRQGDQITFTVREQAVPGHTIDVDELNIHSPNLAIGQTFTTPPLNKAGNFYLYCRPHEQRGHHTRLIVLAPQPQTAARSPSPRATAAPPRAAAKAPVRTAAPTPTATPRALTPVGVGTAPPGSLDRPVPTNPNSLSALTGRRVVPGTSWTRSLWWLLIAAVPIVGAATVALRRARVAQYQPTFENVRRARATPKSKVSSRKKPAPKKKPAPRKR